MFSYYVEVLYRLSQIRDFNLLNYKTYEVGLVGEKLGNLEVIHIPLRNLEKIGYFLVVKQLKIIYLNTFIHKDHKIIPLI